jgi:cytochrome P450
MEPPMPAVDLDDLLSDEAVNRPFSYYPKLRQINPVYWNPKWNGWIVTGYNEVVAGYRDAQRLSSDRFSGPFGSELRGAAAEHPQLLSFLSKFFVWKDPPYHTQMRKLVNKAFSPKSVALLRPRISQLVRELTDALRDREEVDFLSDFAFHLPVVVIAEYLGVPPEARFEVRKWSDDLGAIVFVRGNDTDRLRRGEIAMNSLVEFLRPIVRDRQRDPKDDLISNMVHAEERGERLTEDQVIANAVLMVFAGHETTMNLLANAVVAFSEFPQQWQRIRRDPQLVRTATEEILRYDGPIRGLGRWATESFQLGEQMIAARDRVFLVQHAANHDPSAFQNPDEVDVARWPNKHAAFGQGIHTCLGAPLAQAEAHEALAYLTQEFSEIRVLTQRLEYNPTLVSRSLKHLQVKFCDT